MLKKAKIKKLILPISFAIASIYGSLVFAIGGILGYIGIDIYCKRYVKTERIKMLIFDTKKWEIHLHHWIVAGAVILYAQIFGFIGSIPIMFLGALGGLVFHDIHTDKKFRKNDKSWYHIIYRK